MYHYFTRISIDHPKHVFWAVGILALVALLFIPKIKIDTDPENMLPETNPARVMHESIQHQFGLNNMVVVGLVNHQHPDGVYNTTSLNHLWVLSREVKTLDGVIVEDVMSLEGSDNISQAEGGGISFQWLMNTPPESPELASHIQRAVSRLPLLENTLVSGDGKAAAIYIPVESKDKSYHIYQHLNHFVQGLDLGEDKVYVTGLPVAEDTFGIEMFKQMAISAPAAGLLIFLLMWFFFRSISLVMAPMIVAMATVILTMGLMIGLGYPVHIMSSMIPIFLMPIAVVDSVHMLSEFSDRYRPGIDKKALAADTVKSLFQPMLFTSITSMVGFLSLNTADIPPVKVFGTFIGVGIAFAFLLSILLIPAYMSVMSDAALSAMANRIHGRDENKSKLSFLLRKIPSFSMSHGKFVVLSVMLIFMGSVWGIKKIVINDNPMNWFEETHPIRHADKVLNQHFAGTYEAFLSFHKPKDNQSNLIQHLDQFKTRETSYIDDQKWQELVEKHTHVDEDANPQAVSLNLDGLKGDILEWQFEASDETGEELDAILSLIETDSQESQLFLQYENLQYLESVQSALMSSGFVGKVSGFPDLLKTVNRELHNGEAKDYVLPRSVEANAQAVLTYQSSHRPNDVWHMVTPDYQNAVLWLQLKSGDNKDMSQVVEYMDEWFAQTPPPIELSIEFTKFTCV